MYNWIKTNNIKKKPSRKLCNVSYNIKHLLHSLEIEQYVEWGAKITKVYDLIPFGKKKVFRSFIDLCAQERRTGDVCKAYEPRAAAAKIVMTSAYGRYQMDTTKHRVTKLVTPEQLIAEAYSPFYVDKQELGDERYEVEKIKSRCSRKQCIYLGMAVYQLSKLHYFRYIKFLIDHLRPGSWKRYIRTRIVSMGLIVKTQ